LTRRFRRLAALFVGASIALMACSTTGSRIRSQQELFDSYPAEVQQNIRKGEIDVGYSQEMVEMALGKPDRKVEMQTEDGITEVWTYRKSVPGFSVGMGSGSYIGSGVGIGTGVAVGEPARSEDRAVVEFWKGRVARFRAVAPR
jgi:hypothetical protein